MCNLNIIIKKPGIDVTERLANATAASYASNSDADGIYLDAGDILRKSDNKLNIRKLKDDIVKSSFILCHQRISTSGKTQEFNHPFANERWVLIHNGILGKTEGNKSDTAVFFENFNKRFEEKGDMLEAINKALEDSEGGSYSIFIYDKLNKKGYYFKSYGPSIYGAKLKDGTFFITTSSSNLVFFKSVKWELSIDSEELYEFVLEEDGPEFYKMGKIEDPPTTSYSFPRKYNRSSYDSEWESGYSYKKNRNYEYEDAGPKPLVNDEPEEEKKEEPIPKELPVMSECIHVEVYEWNGTFYCFDCGIPVDRDQYGDDRKKLPVNRIDEFS